MKDYFKDVWSYFTKLTIVNFIKDAFIGGKEFFSGIGEWIDVIVQWGLYIVPIWCTWHFIGPWYIIITIVYLGWGTFIAMFNDSGPMWFSYILLYFWLPYAIIACLVVSPIRNLLINFGLIEPPHSGITVTKIDDNKED